MTKRLKSAIWQIVLLCGTLPFALAADDRPRLSDTTIKSIVEYRLHETGMQRDNKVQVMVDDHVVTLSGSVRSMYEKRRAEQIARSAPDVSGLESKLKRLAESLVRTEVLSFDVVNELTVDSQNASRN